ncbi:MAG TPA: hypothetical protein VFA54_13020, partial [Bryobacterales bacterium]|nr:hypothetical protein [Bryobacterales bacterium]
MNVSAGYTALHESAAWFDLSARGKLRFTGEDRVRLLHAMLSNDVRSLQPGQGNYNFLLNAQGHILADANLYVFPDSILLDVEPEVTERVLQHLDKHIIADDVQVENVTEKFACLALEGPASERMAGISASLEPGAHIESGGAIVARVSATGGPGFRLFVPAEEKERLAARLEQAGAVAASVEDVRVVRVENGVPLYGEDFKETALPQETRQERALNFQKGCYLGQEIVERIRARGHVNKLLVRLGLDVDQPPGKGSAVIAGGQEVGRLTSPVYSPRYQQSLGF